MSLSLSSRYCLYVCNMQSASLAACSLLNRDSLVSPSEGATLDLASLRALTRDLSSINFTSCNSENERLDPA